MLRTLVKGVLLVSVLTVFALHSALVGLFIRSEIRLRQVRAQLLSKYSAVALRVLGVRVSLRARGGQVRTSNYLVVSNHTGYVDALVIASVFPSVFVTSVEVRETPVMGLLARLGGCLFVERRSRRQLPQEVRKLALPLFSGLNVVAFPEATSSNGERVLPFRGMVFDSAIHARVNILPICLEYARCDGMTLGVNEADSLYYYGDMKFFPHFLRLLGSKGFRATMKILESIEPIGPEGRKDIRDKAYERISREYRAGEWLHQETVQ